MLSKNILDTQMVKCTDFEDSSYISSRLMKNHDSIKDISYKTISKTFSQTVTVKLLFCWFRPYIEILKEG